MTLTVTDVFQNLDGTVHAGQTITARPATLPLFVSGVERDQHHVITATTDATGSFTIVMPDQSVCDPATVQFLLTLPDGTTWKGPATAGKPGPYTVKQLKDVLGWGLVVPSTLTPVTIVQGPAGAAGATGATGAPGPAGGSPSYGLDSAKPAAGSAGDKTLYISTDIFGNTIYQVQGGVWKQISPGYNEAPVAHAPSHMYGGTDALSGTLPTGVILTPSSLTGSGTVPLAALAGITTTQLSAAAGIVAAQISAVNPSALTGTGTVPVAGLPTATTAAEGIVKPDGTTITIATGVISAATQTATGTAAGDLSGSYPNPSVANLSHVTNGSLPASGIAAVNPSSLTGTGTVPVAGLPVATTLADGVVKPDGTTITIATGVISAATQTATGTAGGDLSGTYPNPSVAHLTHVTDGSLPASGIAAVNPSSLTGTGTVPPAGLPVATTTTLGAVKVDGTTITIASGVISASASSGHTTAPTLGNPGPKVGTGPTYTLATGSTDNHGIFNITTGTTCVADSGVGGNYWYDVTFGTAFTNPPAVVMTWNGDCTLAHQGYGPFAYNITTTGFRFSAGGANVDSNAYKIGYSVQGT